MPSAVSAATPDAGETLVQVALEALVFVDALIRLRRHRAIAASPLQAEVDAVPTYGAFHVTLPAYRAIKESGYGRLVFVTSAAGLFGN